MDFREALANDIDNVFFNTEEFAETVDIDGKPVPIILDNDALLKMPELFAMGLVEGEQFIFIKEKDMYRPPQPGDQITKNDEAWYVRHTVSNEGVFAIRIGRSQT
ncbi:MAG: hypothetical protein FWB95_02570 [Treponema sp.]|nr:hypothetical protein [Treponema sp.]